MPNNDIEPTINRVVLRPKKVTHTPILSILNALLVSPNNQSASKMPRTPIPAKNKPAYVFKFSIDLYEEI